MSGQKLLVDKEIIILKLYCTEYKNVAKIS